MNYHDRTELMKYVKLDGVAVSTLNTSDLQNEIDKRMKRVFKLVGNDSPVVSKIANNVIRELVDTQKEIFKSKGLNPDRAFKECMVGYTDESSGKMFWRIIPRNVELCEVKADELDTHDYVMAARQMSISDIAGLQRDMRRGKYNDGHMKINESSASIDRSEALSM